MSWAGIMDTISLWLGEIMAGIAIGVAVWIAYLGWQHGTKLARVRLAYDICTATIALLEHHEAEVRDTWCSGEVPDDIDDYTEARLAAFASGVIYRIEILDVHYHTVNITPEQITYLRQLATLATPQLPAGTSRKLELHTLVTEMVITLLQDNHAFVNESVKAKRKSRSSG